MTKFKNDAEVSKYALELDLPTELRTRLSHSALLVGTVRDGIPSARACVILSETEKEQRDTYANSDNKILKSFVESGLKELERELNGLRYRLRDCEEKINLFPPFNPALIRRNAKSILAALKCEDIKTVQRTLHSILKCVKISNEDIETVINMQALMGAYMPLNIVIVEKRDYIARHENHSKRSLTFPALTVKMEQTT